MIKKDSKVSMHYTLTVEGNIVDSSEGKEPLKFVQGADMIIPGLEAELEGLADGDKKSVTVSPADGYGEHDPQGMHKVPRSSFDAPEGEEPMELVVGHMVQGDMNGQGFQAVITEVGDEEITLDLNHPLAGKTLNFDIEIVEVKNESIIVTD